MQLFYKKFEETQAKVQQKKERYRTVSNVAADANSNSKMMEETLDQWVQSPTTHKRIASMLNPQSQQR